MGILRRFCRSSSRWSAFLISTWNRSVNFLARWVSILRTHNRNTEIGHNLCHIGQQIGAILTNDLDRSSKSLCLIALRHIAPRANALIKRLFAQNPSNTTSRLGTLDKTEPMAARMLMRRRDNLNRLPCFKRRR